MKDACKYCWKHCEGTCLAVAGGIDRALESLDEPESMLPPDIEVLRGAGKAVKRFLELTEPLEAANRLKMTDRELDYLQLRHELLGKET